MNNNKINGMVCLHGYLASLMPCTQRTGKPTSNYTSCQCEYHISELIDLYHPSLCKQILNLYNPSCQILRHTCTCIPISVYRIPGKFGGELNEIKFGGLAVQLATAKLKSANTSYLHIYICIAIPYRTAKFKSANIFTMAIQGPTAKFNSRQYFRPYGISLSFYGFTCSQIHP